MSTSNLECQVRERVGSRDARKLRRAGRIPGSLQAEGDHAHINLHLPEAEFLAARRAHVHLFDLQIGGKEESALVRELQWDAMGDHIVHIEFRRVVRGVQTESEVELTWYGVVGDGILNPHVTHITIKSLPSLIPDSIEVNVDGLPSGTHILAGSVKLPEGCSLGVPEDFEIAVVAAARVEVEAPTDEEEIEPIIESEEKRDKKAEDEEA